MKKICLTVVGLYIGLLSAFSQNSEDSLTYRPRKLTFDEANLVSSYYHQDGNHSAVTGGTGTEKLTDISNSIQLKFYKYDRLQRKHSWNFELGIDNYSSASSDRIDPKTVSSASSHDTRIYPSVDWSIENEKKGTSFGAGFSVSNEFDYKSVGANLTFSKKVNSGNGELAAKLQGYFDEVKLIYPIELVPAGSVSNNGDGEHRYPGSSRNTVSTSLSYSQIVNQRLQVMFLTDIIYQHGYLGLPFHRVYFTDKSVHAEALPSSRLKIPVGFRANYFAGDKLVLRSYYRYYRDDWGINAHTFNIEAAVKITPFFSISPFYRYYTQTAAKYFAPINTHTAADIYYTSNFDLASFNSQFLGAGFRVAPPKGVLGIQHVNMLEIRYGHYTKSTDLNANIVSLNLKFK